MLRIESEQLSAVFLRAWTDPEFELRLRADPAQALRSMAIALPHDVQVRLVDAASEVAQSDKMVCLHIPRPPASEKTAIAELAAVAGMSYEAAASPSWTSLLCCKNTSVTSNKCCRF